MRPQFFRRFSFLSKLKTQPQYAKISPVTILDQVIKSKEKLDLPSYDHLITRFIQMDWGTDLKQRPKTPGKTADHIADFVRHSATLNMVLTKEQILALVLEFLIPLAGHDSPQLLTPYKRIEVFWNISKLEAAAAKLQHEEYFDELEEAYERFFGFMSQISIHLQSAKAVCQIFMTMKNANFRDEKLAASLVLHYQMLREFDMMSLQSETVDTKVKLAVLEDNLKVLATLAHFGYKEAYEQNRLFGDALLAKPIAAVAQLLQDEETAFGMKTRAKTAIMSYLRSLTFLGHRGELTTEAYEQQMALVKTLLVHTNMSTFDFCKVYQYVLILKCDFLKAGLNEVFPDENLLGNLKQVWNQEIVENPSLSNRISKAHLDIFGALKDRGPDGKVLLDHEKLWTEATANALSPKCLQDCDILVEKYSGIPLKRPIAIEVNGVTHYPRNSEEPLGKETFKTRVLTELEDFQTVTFPYFETVLMEDDSKRAMYVHSCLASLCEIE